MERADSPRRAQARTPATNGRSSKASSRRSSRSRRSPVEPERKGEVRRTAEHAARCSRAFGATAKIYETKGHPHRPRPLRRDPAYPTVPSTTTSTCSPPTGPDWQTEPFALHARRRPLLRPRHDRRQGAGADGALRRALALRARRAASTSSSSGSSRRRSAARTSRRRSGATPDDVRDGLASSSPTPSGFRASSRPARRACAACRASASTLRDRRDRPALRHDRRRGAQPDGRAVRARLRVLRRARPAA